MANTFVLVHGAWHGAWCFERLVLELAARGVTAVPVELPSHGPEGSALGGLARDVAVVRAALDEIGGPTTLLGHAYGGLVISEAAEHASVKELIYLAAFLPHRGDNLLRLTEGDDTPWLELGQTTDTAPPGRASELFYSDTAPQVATWAQAQLQPQSLASFGDEVQGEGWRHLPTTYLVCSQDRAIPTRTQHLWAQEVLDSRTDSGSVVLNSDHAPFLSQPSELADVLVRGRVTDLVR